MVSRVKARALLWSLHGGYLTAAVGSMKTTPTEALEVVLCQTSLDLAAIEAAGLAACRLKCRVEWKNTGLGHTKRGSARKACLWAAFPLCFLPEWWLSWGVQNSSWLKILWGGEYTSALIAALPNHPRFGNVCKCWENEMSTTKSLQCG